MSDIVTIVGARPQFIKAAVVSKALMEVGIKEDIIHTGQHYDARMSEIFFEELGIPTPVANLEVGSGTHGAQTASMLAKTESFLLEMPKKPAYVMVYGDTNSTLAGALAASKLGIKIIHIEAGLRSFNKSMPEEINRILTDRISDILFCSSESGVRQLQKEGIVEGVHCSGDVMYDAINFFKKAAVENKDTRFSKPFVLLTLHRPATTDSYSKMVEVMNAIGHINMNVIWPVHPRVRKMLDKMTIPENLILLEPLSYIEMISALSKSYKLFTDSGGLQKEAYWLKKPCITLREETEWTETLTGNWNQITGTSSTKIQEAFQNDPSTDWIALYGDGNASGIIANIIKGELLKIH